MSHRTFIESSAVTTAFDWTNMAAALPQFFGAARHPYVEISGTLLYFPLSSKSLLSKAGGTSIFGHGIHSRGLAERGQEEEEENEQH